MAVNRKLLLYKVVFCIIMFIGNAHLAGAQTHQHGVGEGSQCGSGLLMGKQDAAKRQQFEESMLLRTLSTTEDDNNERVLPVVFHVIHENGIENVSRDDLKKTLELVNKAFANEAPFQSAGGVATNIRFCLAEKAPDGSFETAITRHESPLTNITMETEDQALKDLIRWEPRNYINIWVVKSINSLSMGPSVAGYAMMPYSHGSPVDGIVMEAAFLGDNKDGAVVLIHELGHYLGLYHTFEGGCKNDNCLIDGDRVCDTPPDASTAGVPCSGTANTCTTDEDDPSENNPFRAVALGGLGDQPDMHENYMDYGFQSCQNSFTAGQRKRMRDAIANTRSSLLEGVNVCRSCPVAFDVTWDVPDVVYLGSPIEFTCQANIELQYVSWYVNNGQQGVSGTVYSPVLTTSQSVEIGLFAIATAGCLRELKKTIQVICPIPQLPVITTVSNEVAYLGETMLFETPDLGLQYTWKVDGVAAGTGASFSYNITSEAGKVITVEASNGTCYVTGTPYLLTPGNCNVSKENNVWYFGSRGGIDFNQNPPKAIAGTLSTEEGVAVYCDIDGKALFQSMGSNVQNCETGQILLNGDGLTGHFSTTQSALFAPLPGSNRYVYLFTLDYQAGEGEGRTGGLNYSIIDRTGDGGKGEVTTKNVLMRGSMTEKLTAVKNLKGDGIWVIGHEWNSDAFYAWPLTAAGVGTPVVSRVGVVHSSSSPSVGSLAIGELKASYSGKKLALAIQGRGLVELFDFNTATGAVSNPITIENNTGAVYGLAFSPNERFLYASTISGFKVGRWDISSGSAAAVVNSYEPIATVNISGGGMQLAPDGRIYISRRGSQYLSLISNPNAASVADCGYQYNGFLLASTTNAFYGLPNPVQSIFTPVKPAIMGPQQVCIGGTDTTVHYSYTPAGRAQYSWEHKGNNTFSILGDTLVTISFATPGVDTLILKRTAPCSDLFDTIYVRSGFPMPFDLGPDTLVCKEASWVTLAGPPGYAKYVWSNSSLQNQNVSFNIKGTIRLTTYTEAGCRYTDSLRIIARVLPELNLGADTSLCEGNTLTLQGPVGMDSYSWSNGTNGTSITVADSGSYILSVGKHGCIFKDTIHVWKNTPENIFSSDTVYACHGMSDTLVAPNGFNAYTWKTPSGTLVYNKKVKGSETGAYILTYQNNCGTAEDTVNFKIPKMFAQSYYQTCDDSLTIISAELFQSVSRISGWKENPFKINGKSITFYESGRYLFVGNTLLDQGEFCTVSEMIDIHVDTAEVAPVRTINLGADINMCEGAIITLDAGTGFSSYRWNNGGKEQTTTAYGFGTYAVAAIYCGYEYYDTIKINQVSIAAIDLGADELICDAFTRTLDAGSGFDWYQWNTGQTSQQILVATPGIYIVEAGVGGCVERDTIEFIQAGASLALTGDTLLCTGETIVLTATPIAGFSYQWDSLSVVFSSESNTLSVSQPGIYKVKPTGCPTAEWNAWIEVKAETIGIPSFHFSPDSICVDGSVEVTFTASGYDHFRWEDGSTNLPKLLLPNTTTHLILEGHKCSETFVVNVPDVPVKDCGTTNPFKPQEPCAVRFELLPNPSSEYVVLNNICYEDDRVLQIQVFNTEGKLVVSATKTVAEIDRLLNDVLRNTLSAGMYIIRLEADQNYTQHLKWIIHKGF
jgi:hypothetical protein